MSQVTFYIDDATELSLRAAAAAAGVSVSRWIADLVRSRTSATWPSDIARLAGSWADSGEQTEFRAQDGDDLPREPL